jgi:hypothetical protein
MASLKEGFVANGHFQGPRRADIIIFGSMIEGNVPQVPSASQMAPEKATLDDRRPADPGSQGEHEYILQPLSRSYPSLSQEGRVSVVEHWNRSRKSQILLPIQSLQSLQTPGHVEDASTLSGSQPWC